MDNHVRMMPLLMVFAWGYGISCGAKRRIRLWNSARVFARPPWISRRAGYPYGIPWGYEMLSEKGRGGHERSEWPPLVISEGIGGRWATFGHAGDY